MIENKILSPEDYEEPECLLCMKAPNKSTKGRIPIDRIIRKIDASFEKGNINEALRVLEYWLGEARDLQDKQGEMSVLSELIGAYRKLDRKEKALTSVNAAISIMSELGTDTTVSGATVYLNCATALKAFGKAQESIPLYEKVDYIYSKYLSKTDSRFGGLYNNMALAYVDLKKYDKAEELYLKAINIMNNTENGETESAITYINMAHMYEVSGMNEKIQACLDTAYNLLMTEALPKNGHYAYVLESSAPSFEYFGMSDIAKTLFTISGDIYGNN